MQKKFADSCGAGDWFTTGIIHGLCQHGKEMLLGVGLSEINRGIAFAQQLSAWNCGYIGARGGMYSVSGRAALKVIAGLKRTLIVRSAGPKGDLSAAKVCGCVREASTYH
jgi:fructokinase